MYVVCAISSFCGGIAGIVLGNRWNTPELGPVIAIVIIGSFILYAIENRQK